MDIEVSKEELMAIMDCVVTTDANQYSPILIIPNLTRKRLNNFDLSGLYLKLDNINKMDDYLEGPKLRKAYKSFADTMRETKLGSAIIRLIEWLNK